MSVMDKLKDMLKGREDTADQGTDKAADAVDEKTQGKFSDQVDAAQDKIKEQTGGTDQGREGPDQE
ncbi:antitoxin [Streptomyces boncukensis]|uniref:Antitoxin n=1 Tax=Streptomyces boncukensis TaxID=2711219 RepID=A0A6G4X4J5_9ACTN|nr:antitoxin [Streptomyces boncukensis]NGO72445.1 antitoxin [Streptomyces boncukensis]